MTSVLVFVLIRLPHHSHGSRHVCRARLGKAALAFMFGIVLVPGLDLVLDDCGQTAVKEPALQARMDDVVVLSLAKMGLPEIPRDSTGPSDNILAAEDNPSDPSSWTDGSQAVAPPAVEACREIDPEFVTGFQSLRRQVAGLRLERIRKFAALAQTTIIGTASTYNPYNEGDSSGDFETASGQLYDPLDWTAAIQIGLRGYFGGVRYGRNYQPAFVLIESDNKKAIVKINDVGPLRPGRVIDLNDQSMRYFDPSLQRGLVHDMKVTLLPGDDWTPGPVGEQQTVTLASAE